MVEPGEPGISQPSVDLASLMILATFFIHFWRSLRPFAAFGIPLGMKSMGLPLVNSSLPFPYLFSLVTAPPTRQSTTLRPLGYFPIDLGTIDILDRHCQMI